MASGIPKIAWLPAAKVEKFNALYGYVGSPAEIRLAMIHAGYPQHALPKVGLMLPKQLREMVAKWKADGSPEPVDPSAKIRLAFGPTKVSHEKFQAGVEVLPDRMAALEIQREALRVEIAERAEWLRGRPSTAALPIEKYELWWRLRVGVLHQESDNEFEAEMEKLFGEYGIEFHRPERNEPNPLAGLATVDYWLPQFGLYVEVKHWPSDRLAVQVERCMPWPVMVLVRETAVEALRAMLEFVKVEGGNDTVKE